MNTTHSGVAADPSFSRRRELVVLCVLLAITATTFVLLTADVWHANRQVALDRLAAKLGIAEGKDGALGGHPRQAEMAARLGSRKGVGLATAALVGVALVWRQWVAALVCLLAPAVCFVAVEHVAKPLINAPVPFGGRSYPSGHAAGVAAVTISAIFLLYRRWGGLVAMLVAPLAAAPVIAVGLGVLALGFHHYPTDVIGGALLAGTVVATLGATLSWAADRVRPRRHPVGAAER